MLITELCPSWLGARYEQRVCAGCDEHIQSNRGELHHSCCCLLMIMRIIDLFQLKLEELLY